MKLKIQEFSSICPMSRLFSHWRMQKNKKRVWGETMNCYIAEGKETHLIYRWHYKYRPVDRSLSSASAWNPSPLKKSCRWTNNGHISSHWCVLSWAWGPIYRTTTKNISNALPCVFTGANLITNVYLSNVKIWRLHFIHSNYGSSAKSNIWCVFIVSN